MSVRQKLKKVIAVLCVLLSVEVGFFAFQMNSSANRVSRNLDLGNKFLLAEDYDSAISAFSKAIEIDSMNADAYIGRGDAYKAKGDYESAWADYEKAEELSGRNDIIAGKFPERSIHVAALDGTPLSGAEVSLVSGAHAYSLQTDASGNASGVLFPDIYSVTVKKTDYQKSALMADFTYELHRETAFSITLEPVVQEIAPEPVAPEITQENIQLISLNTNVDNTVSVDGVNTDIITIRTDSGNAWATSADLNVNGISMNYALPFVPARFDVMYATDLNVNDGYRNLIIELISDYDTQQTFIFCYNSDSVQLVGEVSGNYDVSYNPGNGTFYTWSFAGYGIKEIGPASYRREYSIDGLALTEVGSSVGYFTEEGYKGEYVNGYPVTLGATLPIYSDADCTQLVGSIPAGTPATITDGRERLNAGYSQGFDFYVESSAGSGWTNTAGLKSAAKSDYYLA